MRCNIPCTSPYFIDSLLPSAWCKKQTCITIVINKNISTYTFTIPICKTYILLVTSIQYIPVDCYFFLSSRFSMI